MGCIYRRGKVYWIKYYRNGKPYAESSHSDKQEVVKRLLKIREGEISRGKLPGICFDRIRLDELVEDFLTDYRINKKRTIAKAERSARHLLRDFEGMRVTDITTPRIKAYIQKRMDGGASNATINRELAALKKMFNLAARCTPSKVAHVPYIPMLKEDNIRKGFFEHGDFLALRDALPEYLTGFVTFAYKTGWRLSEIANLTWSQVNRNQGMVTLDPGETKNREGRTVYLDEELKAIIDKQWRGRMKNPKLLPYVFLNAKGKDKIMRFDKAWKTACKKARIGPRLFHDLRRTAVRNMVRAGVPERVAMMISGHKTRSVFDRYNIVSDSDLRLAAQKQEAYLETQNGYKTVTVGLLHEKRANHQNG
jgi:integrase